MHANESKKPIFPEAASWLLALAWATVIFALSAQTADELGGGGGMLGQLADWLRAWQARLLGPDADILSPTAHFCEYAVLGGLLANALRHRLSQRKALLLAAALASLYGITDEIHQLFVPGRMCDPLDWLVDTAGAALGAWVALAFAKRRTRSRRADCGV